MSSKEIPSVNDCNAVDLKLKGFNVYRIEPGANRAPVYGRRDYYKVCIVTGKSNMHYANRSIGWDDTAIFFANPHIPYAFERLADNHSGYSCLFTEDFLRTGDRSESLQESPLFKIGADAVFKLDEEQRLYTESIFKRMLDEQGSDYIYKNDLVRNYINLLIHEALKMQPADHYFKHKNASERIAALFLELLERQFPIESTEHPLRIRTAQDFAQNLSVHVNHLNRSVKEITGKPTTAHIADRIISEARALLQHTDWNIAEIAYALGFEYPSYFNNFFKRLTGTVPKALRSTQIV